ncbi:MAG: hypothetical protein NVS2B12_08900 [Ktedonobacteraceae bacterium]
MYDSVYHNDLPLALAGMQELQRAEALLGAPGQKPLNVQNVVQAQQEFAAALKNFTQVDNDVSAELKVASVLPVYGKQFRAYLHLIPLAIALSQAGVTGCDLLNLLITRLHEPLSGENHSITNADFNFLGQGLQEIQALLTIALKEVNQIQPSDIQSDARISKLVDRMRKDGPVAQRWLTNIEKALPSMPALLGMDTPTNYFVEILDSTELRPGGGFIGNYGIVTLADAHLAAAHVTDTNLLDQRFKAAGLTTPFPPSLRWFDIARGDWGLRDANLDADFPTAAQAAESLYVREGGDVPVQGVMAITPAFVQQALAITGPVAIPEYHEVVTAQNLVARIHYHQLSAANEATDNGASPDGRSSLRKHFTALLAEHFLAQVRQINSAKMAQWIQIIVKAVHTKDLQVYFNDPAAEMLLHNANVDAAIQSAFNDDVLVVDTNIAVNKASSLITNTLTDKVTIDADGSAVHHATLRYAWSIPGESFGYPLYRDYVRVYVPVGSRLLTQDGWQAQGSSTAFSQQVWAGFFTLTYQQVKTINLTWSVPHAATRDSQGWHYQNLVQKQASTLWNIHVQVTLPACANLVRTSGGMKAASKRLATLDQPLAENTLTALDYAC